MTNKQIQARRLRGLKSRLIRDSRKEIEKVFNDFFESCILELEDSRVLKTIDVKKLFNKSIEKLTKNLKKTLNKLNRTNSERATRVNTDIFNWKKENLEKVTANTIKEFSKKLDVKVKSIVETTVSQIQNFFKKNEIGADFKEKLKERFKEMTKNRSETIASVETNETMTTSQEFQAIENEMKFKTWFHTGRSKVPRPHHKKLNGKKIPINEKFKVGEFEGSFPHDPELPLSETINCTCVIVYSIN